MIKKRINPYVLIILSFISIILIGTVLLVMPFASSKGESFGFVDSLFMATSAVCVTGLSVMPNGLGTDMTIYGKVVMWLLIEVGGLSIITIAVFFLSIIRAKIGITNRFVLREALNQENVKGLVFLVRKIVIISFSVQIVCTLINWYPFYTYLEAYGINDLWRALFISIFHSASAFNNAGFDIMLGTQGLTEISSSAGVLPTVSMVTINLTTMLMIVVGGIGFIIIDDIIRHKKWKRFKLHTKITLITTLLLIVIGTLVIKFTSNLGWMESAFTAITSRTAGFSTWDMSVMDVAYPATYVMVISLMFIGASPCSTGGGIKTTTFAILIIAIFSYATGRKAKAFNRKIPFSQIFKAFVLMNVGVIMILLCTFIIMIIQPELGISKVLFEVVSAFSTTGLSLGITTKLNIASKLILSFLMFFGRLGPLTIIGVVNKNWMNQKKESIDYVEESVIIG